MYIDIIAFANKKKYGEYMQHIKKKILLDLDGVLNTYTGNFDVANIPSIKEGAINFLQELAKNYEIKIFTVRSIELVNEWVIKNNIQNYISGITNTKEAAWLIVDDRCICFNGCYDKLLADIACFKVWHRD